MKKSILSFLFISSCLITKAATEPKDTLINYFTYNDIKYSVIDNSQRTCKTAFRLNSDLKVKDLIIPSKVEYLGNEFTVTEIGEGSFMENEYIETITFPETLTKIDVHAFDKCSNLKGTVKVPGNVKVIGDYAFLSSTLENIIFPENLEEIGIGAFSWCLNFTGPLVLTDNIKKIGHGAFELALNLTGNLVFPSHLEELGKGAFQGCQLKCDFKIPPTLTKIPDCAFFGVALQGEIEIPEWVTSIGEEAFQNKKNITSLILPSGLKEIGEDAFTGCDNIQYIISKAETAPILKSELPYNVFSFKVYQNTSLVVPKNSVNKYKAADDWKNFLNIVPMDGMLLSSTTPYDCYGKHTTKIGEAIPLTLKSYTGQELTDIVWKIQKGSGSINKNGELTAYTPGEITINATAKQNNENISAEMTLTITPVTKGDVNDDFETNVADIVSLSNYLLLADDEPIGNSLNSFCYSNANTNNDDEIDISDLYNTIDLTIEGMKTRGSIEFYSYATQYVEDGLRIVSNNEDKKTEFILDNGSKYSLLQIDLHIPGGETKFDILKNNQLLTHTLKYKKINDNIIRVLLYSTDNSNLRESGNGIISIPYPNLESPKIQIEKAYAIGVDGMKYELQIDKETTSLNSIDSTETKVSVKGNVGCLIISNCKGKEIFIYDIDGRLQAHLLPASDSEIISLPPGIYGVKIGNYSAKKIVR